MADSAQIAEFLIAVGYKLDSTSIARFQKSMEESKKAVIDLKGEIADLGKETQKTGNIFGGFGDAPMRKFGEAARKLGNLIAGVGKQTAALGISAVGTATAYVASMREVSKQYEQLYFIAQRVGTTTSDIAKGSDAYKAVTGSAENYQRMVQNLTSTLRAMPQLRQWVNNAAGGDWEKMKDKTQGLANVLDKLVQMKHQLGAPVAYSWGANFGFTQKDIDDHELFGKQIVKSTAEVQKELDKYGINRDKIAKDAAFLERTYRDTTRLISHWWEQSYQESAPWIQKTFDEINKYLDQLLVWNKEHPGMAMAEGLTVAAAGFTTLSGAIGKVLSHIPGLKTVGAVLGAPGRLMAGATSLGGKLIRGLGGKILGPLGFMLDYTEGAGKEQLADEKKRFEENKKKLEKEGRVLDKSDPETQRRLKEQYEGRSPAGKQPGDAAYAPIPKGQHGGVVRSDLHNGEIVLPPALSQLFLTLSRGLQGGGDRAGRIPVWDTLLSWLTGVGPVPKVQIDQPYGEGGGGGFLGRVGRALFGGGGGAGASAASSAAPSGGSGGRRLGSLAGGGRLSGMAGGGRLSGSAAGSTGELAKGEGAAILDEIAKAEGTFKTGYQSSFGHQLERQGVDITKMTVGEVQALQARMKGSSAIGRYQFMRSTLAGLIRQHKIDLNEKFSPELQDRLGRSLLQRRGYDAWKAGKITDAQFQDRIAQEWAGVTTSTGRSPYAGVGLNVQGKNSTEAFNRAFAASRNAAPNAAPPAASAPAPASTTTAGKGLPDLPGGPGQRRLPPGTLYNSKGEPYSPELLTMSQKEKDNVARTMADIKRRMNAGERGWGDGGDAYKKAMEDYNKARAPIDRPAAPGPMSGATDNRTNNVTVNNNVTVHGGDQATAQRYASIQARQHGDLVRNMRPLMA